jgi:hypothetical protein
MDLFKLIQSFNDLVYEFAISLIHIPRTLIKVIRSPSWTITYVNSQSEEKINKPYERYANPIIFWLTIGVLSYYFLIEFLMQQFADNKVLQVYNSVNIGTKIGGFIILLISIPLSSAFVLQFFKNRNFDKKFFKKTFFVQCYITAPFQLFFLPSFFISELSELWGGLIGIISLSFIIWFLIAQVIISKNELKCGWGKAIVMLILIYFSYYIFMSICFILFVLINLSTFKQLIDAWLGDTNSPGLN